MSNIKSGATQVIAAGFLALLAACTAAPPPVVEAPQPVQPQIDASRWLQPPHLGGIEPVRVALLLPLSASDPEVRQLAQSMVAAAELAIFDQGNRALLLIPTDTAGTPAGAEIAARTAIDQGAEIILGPLFASSVSAVAPVAQLKNIPVIAFSTDRLVAGNGTYLLSFLPENEVDAITRFATSQGIRRFAALIPQAQYGARIEEAFQDSVVRNGASLNQVEPYVRDPQAMFEPARRLANYQSRVASLEEEKQALREAGDEASLEALAKLEDVEVWGDTGYDAVLIPEEGNLLRSLAPNLAYYGVDPRRVKFLGTGLWDDPDITREPSLQGGWFAAPSPEARMAFSESFRQTYGREPPRISSLAYDAVMLASTLSDGPRDTRFTDAEITDPNGFFGIDGIFRFLPDGRSERGLAIVEVTAEGFQVIQDAPLTFERFGS